MSSLYRNEKDGQDIGIFFENKLINMINGLEINLECVIISSELFPFEVTHDPFPTLENSNVFQYKC